MDHDFWPFTHRRQWNPPHSVSTRVAEKLLFMCLRFEDANVLWRIFKICFRAVSSNQFGKWVIFLINAWFELPPPQCSWWRTLWGLWQSGFLKAPKGMIKEMLSVDMVTKHPFSGPTNRPCCSGDEACFTHRMRHRDAKEGRLFSLHLVFIYLSLKALWDVFTLLLGKEGDCSLRGWC